MTTPVTRLWLATVLSLSASTAFAEDVPGHFHRLTPALTARVSRSKPKQFAHNLEAVASYRQAHDSTPGGTAWLVSKPDAHGHAMMITNKHVALYRKKTVIGDQVLFHPGGDTKTPIAVDVVAAVTNSAEHDYALIKVKLPTALQHLKPVKLGRNLSFDYGERIYNPSFPRMRKYESKTPKRLQVGYSQGGPDYGGLVEFFLPIKNGSSGSPVFSQKTHKLVAMMNAGDETTMAMVRPVGRIVADLAAKLSTIKSEKDRRAIESFLR